jgi:hypothetical protein
MEMTTCLICGKIYGSHGEAICKTCRGLADIVYEKARTYLRDHPDDELDADALSEAIGEDKKIVEILMIEGRFTGDPDDAAPIESAAERQRRRLLEDLQKNLASPTQRQARSTYGSDRHGSRD